MKLLSAAALVLFATAPVLASASAFSIKFEKNWDGGNGDVNGYYNGGTAADGTTGPNVGVSFTNVSGLSNASADPGFPFYTNAPSPQGTAYAHTFGPGETAFLNVAAGVSNALSFYYSSPSAVLGGVKAYAGLNGTGALLGIFNLAANIVSIDGVPNYNTWTLATFRFGGVAESFDLTAAANSVLFDDIGTVPEPGTLLMIMLGGLAVLGARSARRS